MEYQVQDLSPVKKKVQVQVPAEEVNAALEATIAFFRKDLKISGFRKGKVPSSVVESKFKNDIYQQAGQDLLNVHFSQVFGELGVEPLSGIDVDEMGQMERDQDFNYSFSFEVRPEIELPEYHGLQATQRQVQVTPEMVENMLSRLQREQSELVLTKEDRPPHDGEVAVISFAAYKDGQPLSGVQSDNLELPLGEGQALQEFEEIVKGLQPGQTGQGEISFPQDFLNQELAGQTAQMEVTLNVIKQRQLPELDDDFAAKLGFENMQQLRDAVQERFKNYFERMERSNTQKKILDQIVSQVQVELPESLVESQLDRLLENKRSKLEQQGKSLEAEGTEQEIKQKMRPEAEELVKAHLVLLEVARREDLSVSNQEVEQHLYRIAMESGEDPKKLKDYYEQNNLMFALRDSLLADKAMESIYEHAQIEEVQVSPEEEEQEQDQAAPAGDTNEEQSQETEDPGN
ncbi:MAG: trigger factor [Desulfohalobiaceae bacterium]